jgi:hypothetical protein
MTKEQIAAACQRAGSGQPSGRGLQRLQVVVADRLCAGRWSSGASIRRTIAVVGAIGLIMALLMHANSAPAAPAQPAVQAVAPQPCLQPNLWAGLTDPDGSIEPKCQQPAKPGSADALLQKAPLAPENPAPAPAPVQAERQSAAQPAGQQRWFYSDENGRPSGPFPTLEDAVSGCWDRQETGGITHRFFDCVDITHNRDDRRFAHYWIEPAAPPEDQIKALTAQVQHEHERSEMNSSSLQALLGESLTPLN